MKPWTVVLADDQPVLLAGLKEILNRPEFRIVGTVADGHALVKACRELQPDLIISDITLPLLSGIEAVRQISKHCPRTKIVFLTMHHEVAYAVHAIRAGAKGYVVKTSSPEEVVKAIHQVLHNRVYITPSLEEAVLESLHARPDERGEFLTRRQREILQLLAQGKQPKEIASILHISPRTVEFHKYRTLQRLGMGSMAELIAWAAKKDVL